MAASLRAYSLVAVLAAMVILMAVVMPLLSLQGRIRQAAARNPAGWLELVERDVCLLRTGAEPVRDGELIWQGRPITRRITTLGGRTRRVDYQLITAGGSSRQVGTILIVPDDTEILGGNNASK